jgi:hypothetical protein
MIIVIKLGLVFLMVALLIVPILDFLFYQPGRNPSSGNSRLDSFLKGFQDGLRQDAPPKSPDAMRIIMTMLFVFAFIIERNWGFLLLGFMPLLAYVRERLTPVKRIRGDERDFVIRLKATALSLVIAVIVPLIFSILRSFQVDAFTLLSAIFILSEVIRIAILRFLAPIDTLEPEEGNAA